MERDDFKVGEFRNNPTTGYVSEFIHTICGEFLADSKYSDEICHEIAHKQCNASYTV